MKEKIDFIRGGLALVSLVCHVMDGLSKGS